jgi:hypothetical protein
MTRTLLEILEKVRERVRPVCPNMPEDEFNVLTAKMAELEYKYDQRLAVTSTVPPEVARGDRRSP